MSKTGVSEDPLSTQKDLFSSDGSFIIDHKTRVDLHLEDCFLGMKKLPQGSVDVVVTSPPYNLGVKYRVYNDRISREDYLDWLEKWAVEVARVLSPSGSLFLNIGGKPKDPWGPMEVAFRFRKHLQLPEHHPLDQVHRHRQNKQWRRSRTQGRCKRRTYQTYKSAVGTFQMPTSTFSISPNPVMWNWNARP